MRNLLPVVAGMFFFLTTTSFLFGSNPVASDTGKNPKKLQISAGYYNLGSVDEIYSDHLYSGHDICYGLKYYYGKGAAREFTSLRMAMVDRTPHSLVLDDNTYGESDRARILNSFLFEAIYSYQYPIRLQGAEHLKLFVTGDWITTVNLTTNSYGVPELVRSGISPGVQLEANFNRHILNGRFYFPLVSWTVRNNYSQSMTQNYESLDKLYFVRKNDQLQFLNTLQEICAELEYRLILSDRFDIGCEYDFRYMHNSSPRELRSATGIYTAYVTYKF
ncbi:MAG TPA: hypothetical protein PKH79_00660 [Prolixibacteraceae bacterium]|nr:hypothetical protein [Prolixibacteraceae bacterium]HPS14116.1 hypothetical protein [Prolixibacteraceae bacterium]